MSACRKARYLTRQAARDRRRLLIGLGRADRRIRPYRCLDPGCEGAWHLGHLPRAVRRGRVARGTVYGSAS